MKTSESTEYRNKLIKAKVTKATVCVLATLPKHLVTWQSVATFFGVSIPTLNKYNTGQTIPIDGLAKMLQVLGELDDWVQNIENAVSNATAIKGRALPMVKPINLSTIEQRIAPIRNRIEMFDPDSPATHWISSDEAIEEREIAISAFSTCLHYYIKHEKFRVAEFSAFLPIDKVPTLPTMQRLFRGNVNVNAHIVLASLQAVERLLIERAVA